MVSRRRPSQVSGFQRLSSWHSSSSLKTPAWLPLNLLCWRWSWTTSASAAGDYDDQISFPGVAAARLPTDTLLNFGWPSHIFIWCCNKVPTTVFTDVLVFEMCSSGFEGSPSSSLFIDVEVSERVHTQSGWVPAASLLTAANINQTASECWFNYWYDVKIFVIVLFFPDRTSETILKKKIGIQKLTLVWKENRCSVIWKKKNQEIMTLYWFFYKLFIFKEKIVKAKVSILKIWLSVFDQVYRDGFVSEGQRRHSVRKQTSLLGSLVVKSRKCLRSQRSRTDRANTPNLTPDNTCCRRPETVGSTTCDVKMPQSAFSGSPENLWHPKVSLARRRNWPKC